MQFRPQSEELVALPKSLTALSVAAITVGSSLVSTAPAQAYNGSFNWTASVLYSLQSRDFTTGAAGQVRINLNSFSNCPADAPYIAVTLYRRAFPWDTNLGTAKISCSGGFNIWYGESKDTYYFVLNATDPGTGSSRVGSGTTLYQ